MQGSVFAVTVPNTSDPVPPTIAELTTFEIPPSWLPDVDVRIVEQPDASLELAAFSAEELLLEARRDARHLVALEFSSPGTEGLREARVRVAGPLMVEFQAMADTMSAHSDFALRELQAASVVIVLAPATGDGLFAQAAPTLLDDLDRLFELAGEGQEFLAYLADHSSRTRAHIRDFFTVPSDFGGSLEYIAAPPSGPLIRRRLPLSRIRAALRVIRESKMLPDDELTFDGHLEGINHTRRTFSVRRVPAAGVSARKKKGKVYAGKFDPDVDIEGLASGLTILYRFNIVREAEESEFGVQTYKNRITNLTRLTQE